jgi:glycosyltransferase involved in cell wall biosynthesis
MKNAVWLTWESQRRNKTLSKALDVDYFQLEMNTHRLLRYPLLILKTLRVLIRHRPKIIFAQNPSIFLATLAVVYGKLFNKVVVVDCHNAGVFPFEGKKGWANRLSYFIFANASLIIVTNQALKEYVESKDGEAIILPDPFPEISAADSGRLRGRVNFLLISTWADDEPYEEVIKSFSTLPDDWVLYISGNSKGRENSLSIPIPDNVVLTGFISDQEYDELLGSCDAVIDLTTREDCLVCGAYEAVSAGKPLILSDTRALRDYFKHSAVYTENTSGHIANAIKHTADNLQDIADQVISYREQQEKEWFSMLDNLKSNVKCKL